MEAVLEKEEVVKKEQSKLANLQKAVTDKIIGQKDLIENMLVCFFSGWPYAY